MKTKFSCLNCGKIYGEKDMVNYICKKCANKRLNLRKIKKSSEIINKNATPNNNIIHKSGMIIRVMQKKTTEPCSIFCDHIEYMHRRYLDIFDHHLMIYKKSELIFKVWLPNQTKDEDFRDIHEALASVGMKINYPENLRIGE